MGRVNNGESCSTFIFNTKLPVLLAGILAGSISVSGAWAQPVTGKAGSTAAPRARSTPHLPVELPPSAKKFYASRYGVDLLSAKAIDSGMLIRFNYRVVDPAKAKMLADHKATPYLIDEKARVKLVVPSLAKVGELRNKATPEEGRTYWMVFSNKGNFVKPGHRVSVEIGKFRVDGLVVQ